MIEIKGSSYKVDGVEFGSYIPEAEIKDMEKTRVQEIWDKMNNSEKFGCQLAMFPVWVMEYKLTHEEVVELMGMKK